MCAHDFTTELGHYGTMRRQTSPPCTLPPNIFIAVLAHAGPCVGMDTACSSSMVATHLAHQGLQNRETSAAVSAGVNFMLIPETGIHMAELGALSPTGRWDARMSSFAPSCSNGPSGHALQQDND